MDSEALQRVRNWLEGGCSSWGVPMEDLLKMPDTIVAQANEIEWLNTLIGDKATKQIEADGNRIEAQAAEIERLRGVIRQAIVDGDVKASPLPPRAALEKQP